MFKITDHDEFNNRGRAICPCCALDGKTTKRNLALIPDTDGAYKCHRGCSPDDIRDALGQPKPQQIPAALVKPPAARVTVTPQKVKAAHDHLVKSGESAKAWLNARGITLEMTAHYRLGAYRARVGKQGMAWAIGIPIPNHDGTQYYIKKRVAPWDKEIQQSKDYQPWSQYGIPPKVLTTQKPEQPKQTWLCEGEWDAIMLGWAVSHNSDVKNDIQVSCFTCGAGSIPPAGELDQLAGDVIVFYDRNDKPLKDGTIPGEAGAQKVAIALGNRGAIAQVPMPENCTVNGWDVSDALNSGFTLEHFIQAAAAAVKPEPTTTTKAKADKNPLRSRLVWNDDLLDRAPDYTEWLVDEVLTADELFLLAAGPRAGKSLLAMTLAKTVAEGGEFLGRPVTQGKVIYVCLEDGEAKLKERETAQGWSRGLPVAWLQKFKLSELPHLREIAEELDPRLIVLDTLSRIKDSTVSESSAEMSQILEPLQEMAKDLGCCILLVHHTGKVSIDNANTIDVFDTVRGSSAIRAVCRGTLIIAAGEKNYRLFVENGWKKHDLNVVLDSNTWSWRLIGQWKPGQINLTQKDQIIDYLKQVGQATIEQIHEATKIPQKSLYEQLSRLQTSEDASSKVVKTGARRKYLYHLALFNTIQQLNSVLNSENPNPESVTDAIQQKNISSLSEESDQRDQTPDHTTRTTAKSDQTVHTSVDAGLSAFGITYPTELTKPASDKGLTHADHSDHKYPPTTFVEYRHAGGSNVDGESVSPIQHPIQQTGGVEYKKPDHNADVVRETVISSDQRDQDDYDDEHPEADCEVIHKGWTWTAKYVRDADKMMLCSKTRKLEPVHRVELWVKGKPKRVEVTEPHLYRPLLRSGDTVEVVKCESEPLSVGTRLGVVRVAGRLVACSDGSQWRRDCLRRVDGEGAE